MQRIMNNPDYIVEDMLHGFVKAHSDIVEITENPRVVRYVEAGRSPKVGVVTGGGSGHKPAFIGYIGRNMLDCVAVGEIFSSPTAKSFLDAIKEADSGNGVACLYGNYAGDNMNVKMAVKMAEKLGIKVRTVIANDDVASASKDEASKRRGVAGEILMWKIGGAKAAMGGTLDEVIKLSQAAIDNCRSVGVGLSSCTIPAVGKPNFTIPDGMMEVGIGHHGEPGVEVLPITTAKEIARSMTDMILPDLPFVPDDEVCVLISGLGGTPVMELYVLYNEVGNILAEKGIKIYRSYVGNYFTSLDMMGSTLTIMKLNNELKECLDLETDAVSFKQFQKTGRI
jgi:dihydroxyacetone kinase-like protein